MTDKEKIRAEIERRYKEFDGKTGDIATASRLAYLDVLSYLDTLPEEPEPSEDLEEEINRYLREDCSLADEPWDWRDKKDCARHFAEWGAEHIK